MGFGNKYVYPSEGTRQTNNGKMYVYNEGISKRELFAAMAMQGLLSNSHIIQIHQKGAIDWIAEHSILQADALLNQLEKEEEK